MVAISCRIFQKVLKDMRKQAGRCLGEESSQRGNDEEILRWHSAWFLEDTGSRSG